MIDIRIIQLVDGRQWRIGDVVRVTRRLANSLIESGHAQPSSAPPPHFYAERYLDQDGAAKEQPADSKKRLEEIATQHSNI